MRTYPSICIRSDWKQSSASEWHFEDEIRNIDNSIDAVEDFLANGGNIEAFKLAMSHMPLGELANQDAAIEARRTQLEFLIEDLEFEDQQLSFRLGADHPDRQRNQAQIELYCAAACESRRV